MADAWGVLTFSKSFDCEMDGKKLTDDLNLFNWDNWGGKWEYDEKTDILFYSEKTAQYPTVFPQIQTVIHCFSEDTKSEYTKLVSEMTKEDWDNFEDADYEDCSLEQMKSIIQKNLYKGWIEIACCSNEKLRYISYETLKIEQNSIAIRSSFCSGPQSNCENFTERF